MQEFPWNLVIPPVVVLILGGGRMLVPKMPGWLVVLLAPALGMFVDLLGERIVSGWENHGMTGATMGMLATWLHQLGKQASKTDSDTKQTNNTSAK